MEWIATGVISLSVIVIVILVLRKIPQLRVIDVESIPKEKMKAKKEELILQRFERKRSGSMQKVARASFAVVRGASKIGRRAVQKLYSMEQYYQKLKRVAEEGHHAYDKETVRKFIDQADGFVKEGEVIPAEKIYIDIISHNPKNVDAYEGLGNLYRRTEKFDQARETFAFTLKLSPNDASVRVALAELEMEEGNDKKALEHLRKAIEKRSKNPKYLDFYIEAALKAGSLKDARKGMKLLRDVNPENKKLEAFDKRFEKLKTEYIEKTSSEPAKKF